MISDKRIAGGRAEFLAAWVLLGVLATLTISMVSAVAGHGASYSPLVLCAFAAVGVWSLVAIASDSRFLSLYKVHYYFVLTFMFLAPLCQYISGYSPWGYKLADGDVLWGCLVVIAWLVVFEASYRVRVRSSGQGRARGSFTLIPDSPEFRGFLLAVSVASFITLVALVGFSGLLTRGESNIGDTSSPVLTLLNYFLRAVPLFSLGSLLLSSGIKGHYAQAAVLFAIVLVVVWPVSSSRYLSASTYIGLFLCLAYPRMKDRRTHVVDYAFLLAICAVFPLMSLFKSLTLEEVLGGDLGRFFSVSGALGFMVSGFNSIDFDAFSVVCRAREYVADSGNMLGRQLLSVVFFFVPRAILPIKGTPTGALIADAQGQWYTNISCPLPAEGFVDFGYFGVLVYAFALGKLLRWLDGSMAGSVRSDGFLAYVYCMLPGLMFFMLRGALQPTFLRAMGLLSFCLLVWFLIYNGRRSREASLRRAQRGKRNESVPLRGRV